MLNTFVKLLRELAEHMGQECCDLLEQQEVRIGGLSIFLQFSGDEETSYLVLCSVLGRPGPERLTQVMQTVLQANHLWVGTAGGTLGLSPAGDSITWCLRLPMRDLDGAMLAQLLAGFAELGQAWMKYIAGQVDDAAAMQALSLDARV